MTKNKLLRTMLPTFACAVCLAAMGGLEHEVLSQETSKKETLGEFRIDDDPRRIKEEQDRFSTVLDDFPEEVRLQLISRGIYGKDSRIDWGQIKDEKVKAIARSSVALFKEISIEGSQGGKFRILAERLGDHSFEEANGSRLCKNERFIAQLSASFCSGVLVAEDLVVTAGHCIAEVSKDFRDTLALHEIRFVFGFTAENEKDPGRSEFDARQIYRGIEVIGGNFASKKEGGEDWAVVRIDRKVPNDVALPVKGIRATDVKKGERVYAIGYPTGLPLKYAAGAEIGDDEPGVFFVANLNSFQGNSGSGVFLSGTNELVGILVRGDRDYYRDEKSGGCTRVHVCPRSGCNGDGEDVTRIGKIKIPKFMSDVVAPQ